MLPMVSMAPRLGIYTWLLERFAAEDGTAPSFLKKVAMGGCCSTRLAATLQPQQDDICNIVQG